MKKIFLFIAVIFISFTAFGQFLIDIAPGNSGTQTRNAINGNNTIIEDTINYFYDVNILNGAAIDTALARAGRVGDGDAGPYFDGSSDGGQILYFYGNNGFWTALQGGAPTANRSYRLPIAALPSAGDSAYIVIDQYGNMLFVPYVAPGGGTGGGTYTEGSYIDITNNVVSLDTADLYGDGTLSVELSDSTGGAGHYLSYNDGVNGLLLKLNKADSSGATSGSYLTGNDFTQGQLLKINKADSTGYASGNYIPRTQFDAAIEVLDSEKLGASEVKTFFVFGVGAGAAADTAALVNGAEAGSFFWSTDTLHVDALRTRMKAGSGTETIKFQLYWGADYPTATDSLFSSATTITDLTGNTITSFTHHVIPPASDVWGIISGASSGNKPTLVRADLIGYTKRD